MNRSAPCRIVRKVFPLTKHRANSGRYAVIEAAPSATLDLQALGEVTAVHNDTSWLTREPSAGSTAAASRRVQAKIKDNQDGVTD